MDLIDRVADLARQETAIRIMAVDVRIGTRSGVDCEAFRFAYTAATPDTPLAQAQLRIEETGGDDFQLVSLEVQDV